ncbi:hypothetical protein GCM10023156_12500 [Novipirellula rosea]|uniref:Uncharacterized protein n=1 Tax=Novipirellula rosea TaxID=1031540 RepID=A0ABP8MEW5_9BACT
MPWVVITARQFDQKRLRINGLIENQTRQLLIATKHADIQRRAKRVTHRVQYKRRRPDHIARHQCAAALGGITVERPFDFDQPAYCRFTGRHDA